MHRRCMYACIIDMHRPFYVRAQKPLRLKAGALQEGKSKTS